MDEMSTLTVTLLHNLHQVQMKAGMGIGLVLHQLTGSLAKCAVLPADSCTTVRYKLRQFTGPELGRV